MSHHRVAKHLPTMLEQLAPSHAQRKGLVVASTAHWSWRVDGLRDASRAGAWQQWPAVSCVGLEGRSAVCQALSSRGAAGFSTEGGHEPSHGRANIRRPHTGPGLFVRQARPGTF